MGTALWLVGPVSVGSLDWVRHVTCAIRWRAWLHQSVERQPSYANDPSSESKKTQHLFWLSSCPPSSKWVPRDLAESTLRQAIVLSDDWHANATCPFYAIETGWTSGWWRTAYFNIKVLSLRLCSSTHKLSWQDRLWNITLRVLKGRFLKKTASALTILYSTWIFFSFFYFLVARLQYY